MTEKKKGGRLKAVRSEFKKVVWPTKKQVMSYCGVVILIALIVAFFCWILDLAFSWAIGLFF